MPGPETPKRVILDEGHSSGPMGLESTLPEVKAVSRPFKVHNEYGEDQTFYEVPLQALVNVFLVPLQKEGEERTMALSKAFAVIFLLDQQVGQFRDPYLLLDLISVGDRLIDTIPISAERLRRLQEDIDYNLELSGEFADVLIEFQSQVSNAIIVYQDWAEHAEVDEQKDSAKRILYLYEESIPERSLMLAESMEKTSTEDFVRRLSAIRQQINARQTE